MKQIKIPTATHSKGYTGEIIGNMRYNGTTNNVECFDGYDWIAVTTFKDSAFDKAKRIFNGET